MAADGRCIPPRYGTGERRHRLLAGQVLERPLHERSQCPPRLRVREPGMPQQPLRHRLHHHEIVGSEHRARVINRLGLGRDVKRPQAEIVRQRLGRPHRGGHSLDCCPGALQPVRCVRRIGDGLERMEGPEGRAGPDQGAERFLTLGAGEVQHHLVAVDRSCAGQCFGEGPDGVVPHGQNDDARLGDPGGRGVLRANGQREGFRDRFLAAAVQADVVASPLPHARERERQTDTGAAGSDDPHDVGRHLNSAGSPVPGRRPGRGGLGATWRGVPGPARPAPGGLPPSGGALPPDDRTRSVRSRIPGPG